MLERLLSGGPSQDGQAAALEEQALRAPPGQIAADATTGRRDRVLLTGHDVLADVTAQKVLHGWLQNQHQTMFPLTVNLRVLDGVGGTLLARWMAVALLASPDALPERTAAARRWLETVGAAAPVLAALDAGLADPPPLSAVLHDVAGRDLAAYAYVVALVALDRSDAASAPFLDYVAARLALPTAVTRSANRRYGA